MLPPTFVSTLVSARALSPAVRELTFERDDGAPFAFEAGQWVNLLLPDEMKRSYSIASPPSGTSRFEIAVTHVQGGPGSTYLHALAPGAKLSVMGPQGFFTRAARTPSLFVATGTGVTPIRSMLHAAIAQGDDSPLWLLFGVRHEEDILFREELEGLAEAHPNVRVIFSLSQPPPPWTGRRGYVQTHVKELWQEMEALGKGAPHLYACGLLRMVGSVRDLLRKDMNVARQQVHTERYD
jgi:ferredoxin-NADP reductase